MKSIVLTVLFLLPVFGLNVGWVDFGPFSAPLDPDDDASPPVGWEIDLLMGVSSDQGQDGCWRRIRDTVIPNQGVNRTFGEQFGSTVNYQRFGNISEILDALNRGVLDLGLGGIRYSSPS